MLKSIISACIFQQLFFVITQTVLLSFKAFWEARCSKSGTKLHYWVESRSANHWRADLFTCTAHWTAQRSVQFTCATYRQHKLENDLCCTKTGRLYKTNLLSWGSHSPTHTHSSAASMTYFGLLLRLFIFLHK